MNYCKILVILLFLFGSVLLYSCDRNTASSERSNPLDLTPRENAEAEEAALWLSNEIVAPQDLYEKVLNGFNLLREKYADSIPDVNIPFVLPFNSSRIRIEMSDSAIIAIRAGNYDEWDSLNTYYHYSRIDTATYPWGEFYIYLIFEGRINTHKLCDIYEKLPGVIWANTGGYVGDWPCTYPWIDSADNLTFLVRKAWGDCPSGCILSHFYYFKMRSGNLDYIGDWEFSYPPFPPDWWDEAKVAYETYRFYPGDSE